MSKLRKSFIGYSSRVKLSLNDLTGGAMYRQLVRIVQQTPELRHLGTSARWPDSALACNMRLSHTQPNATSCVVHPHSLLITLLTLSFRTRYQVSIDF